MAHYIVYSHGFGVRQDARGMFTELAAALPHTAPLQFDYNIIGADQRTLTVQPIDKQVAILQAQLAAIPAGNTVDLIAHSQGCIITALALPEGVRRIILLAPPDQLDFQRMVGIFGKHPASVINPTGEPA